MKLVVATPLYPPEIGGPATYVKEIVERLKNEYSITTVAYANTGEEIPGTKLVLVNKREPLIIRLIKFTIALYRASKDADVLYAQNAVAAGLPAVIVGSILRKPVVIKFVGDEAWERATQSKITTKQLEDFLASPDTSIRTKIFMAIQGYTLRHAQAVTTPSLYLTEAIVKTYSIQKNRAIVNYNAAEKTEVIPFEVTKIPHQIAVTARLVEWKGIAGIIRTLPLVQKEFPDTTLVIAGDGPEEQNLKKLTTELKLENSVKFLGRVSRAETWHMRKQSEVYVLNSSYEGLPHTALTSFIAEIPMVATDIPGTNEAVYNEKTGLLVPLGDNQALANAIVRLFRDDELKKKLTEGAKQIMTEKFSWESHLANLKHILESVSTKPSN